MSDVTGPISTLPGSRHAPPEGAMCDEHPDRPAVVRVQGETDSMGCEMYDLCDECAKAERDHDDIGRCDWCKTDNVKRQPRRDIDEGMYGPVYYVCKACADKDEDALRRELDDDGFDDDAFDDIEEDEE